MQPSRVALRHEAVALPQFHFSCNELPWQSNVAVFNIRDSRWFTQNRRSLLVVVWSLQVVRSFAVFELWADSLYLHYIYIDCTSIKSIYTLFIQTDSMQDLRQVWNSRRSREQQPDLPLKRKTWRETAIFQFPTCSPFAQAKRKLSQ